MAANDLDAAGVTELLNAAGETIGVQFTQTGGPCDSNDVAAGTTVPASFSM